MDDDFIIKYNDGTYQGLYDPVHLKKDAKRFITYGTALVWLATRLPVKLLDELCPKVIAR